MELNHIKLGDINTDLAICDNDIVYISKDWVEAVYSNNSPVLATPVYSGRKFRTLLAKNSSGKYTFCKITTTTVSGSGLEYLKSDTVTDGHFYIYPSIAYNFNKYTPVTKLVFNSTTTLPKMEDCTTLLEVELNAMVSLPERCFAGCTNLKIINFDYVKAIGALAFYNLTKITGTYHFNNLTKIEKGAFQNTTLKNAYFYDKLQTVTANPFICNSIENIFVINNSKFSSGDNNDYLYDTISKTIYATRCSSNTAEIVLPDDIEIVGENAFRSYQIKHINTDNIKEINRNGFDIVSTGSLNFPVIKKIGEYAFGTLKNNNTFTLTFGDKLTSIAGNAFGSKCSSIKLYSTIPPTISSTTFNDAAGLNTIYVPEESVTAYQTAANWSKQASKIKAITE